MNVNYNLLKALDALLTEVHVTRAGEKIFLTQAATSNALSQLRDIFKDPLLIRAQGSQMYLTPFAKSLKPRVTVALQQLQDVFSQNHFFEPHEVKQTFHIAMSDYIESILLTKLMTLFYREAPQAKLIIHHLNYLEDEKLLENGELDLALGNFPAINHRLNKSFLFEDSTAFFARHDHPIFTKKIIHFKHLTEYPIIMVDYADKSKSNYLEQLLQDSQYTPAVNVTVPHAYNTLNNILENNFITHSAMKLAKPLLDSKKIKTITNIKGLAKKSAQSHFKVYQYWHENLNGNKAHLWLRNMLLSLPLD